MKSLKILIACLILIVACGPAEEAPSTTGVVQETATDPPPPPPGIEEAKKLIADSPAFSDYQFTNASYSLPLKRSRFNEVTRRGAEELQAAGWIRLEGDDVVLEPKAESDRRWLVRPNGFVDIVPIAKKELTEVSSIVPQADGDLKANLCWQWIPNEIGSAFKSGLVRERIETTHCAIAELQPSEDGGWEVLLVEPAPAPSEE